MRLGDGVCKRQEFVRTSCVKHEFVRRNVCETCVWETACVCDMSPWEKKCLRHEFVRSCVCAACGCEKQCVCEFGRRSICETWVREEKSVWDLCSWKQVCVRNEFVRSNVCESSGDEVCVRHEFVRQCRSFPLMSNVIWKQKSNELTSLRHIFSRELFLTYHELMPLTRCFCQELQLWKKLDHPTWQRSKSIGIPIWGGFV